MRKRGVGKLWGKHTEIRVTISREGGVILWERERLAKTRASD